jgi:hypothetical protein
VVKQFAAIGAPSGHARCSIETTTYALANGNPCAIVVLVCQCGKRFTLRDDLVAHHNLIAMLLATTISEGKRS